MSCPGCEIHKAIHGVTKQSAVRPKDDPIPTSSKKSRLAQTSPVVEIQSDGTVPEITVLDGSDDGGPK